MIVLFFFFFFQAEDGIRDLTVTGVQTCALPISPTFPIEVDVARLQNTVSRVPVLFVVPVPCHELVTGFQFAAFVPRVTAWLWVSIIKRPMSPIACAGQGTERLVLVLDCIVPAA